MKRSPYILFFNLYLAWGSGNAPDLLLMWGSGIAPGVTQWTVLGSGELNLDRLVTHKAIALLLGLFLGPLEEVCLKLLIDLFSFPVCLNGRVPPSLRSGQNLGCFHLLFLLPSPVLTLVLLLNSPQSTKIFRKTRAWRKRGWVSLVHSD